MWCTKMLTSKLVVSIKKTKNPLLIRTFLSDHTCPWPILTNSFVHIIGTITMTFITKPIMNHLIQGYYCTSDYNCAKRHINCYINILESLKHSEMEMILGDEQLWVELSYGGNQASVLAKSPALQSPSTIPTFLNVLISNQSQAKTYFHWKCFKHPCVKNIGTITVILCLFRVKRLVEPVIRSIALIPADLAYNSKKIAICCKSYRVDIV